MTPRHRNLGSVLLLLTTAALLATSAVPDDQPSDGYRFEQVVQGTSVELTDTAPSAVFAIRVRLSGRAPNGRPFEPAVTVRASGELEHLGAAEGDGSAETRWLTVALRPIVAPQQLDAGAFYATSSSPSAMRLLNEFSAETRVNLYGDCEVAPDAALAPCEGTAVLALDSGGGAEALRVTWHLNVLDEAWAEEQDTLVPAPIEVVVTPL